MRGRGKHAYLRGHRLEEGHGEILFPRRKVGVLLAATCMLRVLGLNIMMKKRKRVYI